MTRAKTSAWVASTIVLVTACGGVQAPDSPHPSIAPQKVAGVSLVAVSQTTQLALEIVNPPDELLEFAPDGILRWSEVAGADAYEVWVYADPTLSQVVESSRTLQWRQYQFTRLAAGQTYHVVVYYRDSGVWRATPRVTLTTAAPVSKPRLTNPQDELDALAIGGQLQWTAVAGAAFYELWLFADEDLSILAETSGPIRERTHRLQSVLPGRTYHAVVFANVGGEFHAGGALPVKVIEAANVPRFLNPPDELEAFSVRRPTEPGRGMAQLRWSAVPDAGDPGLYEVWIFGDPNAAQVVASSGPTFARQWIPWALGDLAEGSTYYAQVFALVNGEWRSGAPVKMTTTGTTEQPRLTNTQAQLEAFLQNDTLRWTEVPGAQGYEVWIFGNAGLSVVTGSAAVTDISYSVGDKLCAGATYYVQIHALVDGQWSAGSATLLRTAPGSSAATCVPPVPEVTLTVTPADIVDGDSVTLAWSSRHATSCMATGDWSGERPASGQQLAGPLSGPAQFTLACTGPSGASTVHRLVQIANYRPVASFTASRSSGFTPLAVEFDALASFDRDGSIVDYRWDFGDGASANGAKVAHTFDDFGVWEVTLTVTDDGGAAGSWSSTVSAMPGTSVARYSLTEIPTLDSRHVEPFAINNKGEVVGFLHAPASTVRRAFLYSDGVTRDLGTFGGVGSEARDISDNGFIVGVIDLEAGVRRGFLYRDGSTRVLGTLGGTSSEANGVNEAGHVVGFAENAEGFARAFVDTYGLLVPIGTLGGSTSVATDINDRVQVTGFSSVLGGRRHAFLASGTNMIDLGTLGGLESFAAAINDVAQVAGVSTAADLNDYAFLYGGGVMQNLGALSGLASKANDLNDIGVVVGDSDGLAFVWDRVNGMRNLNLLVGPIAGLTLQAARGINEWGQIVAQAKREDGSTVAVVLTPQSEPMAQQP